jgi:hypothetical protein
MNPRQIFETQQQLVTVGSQQVSNHLTRMQKLLHKFQSNNNNTNNENKIIIQPTYNNILNNNIIGLRIWGSEELLERERNGFLGLLINAITTTTTTMNDPNNNNTTAAITTTIEQKKQLAALTFICDEIWCLERHAQDALYPNLCLASSPPNNNVTNNSNNKPPKSSSSRPNRLVIHNAHRVARRVQSLSKNVLFQLSGLLSQSILFTNTSNNNKRSSNSSSAMNGIEYAIPCWLALADSIITLSSLDLLLGLEQQTSFVRALILDDVFARVARETLGMACSHVIKHLLDFHLQRSSPSSLKDAMRICSLYIVAHRLGQDKEGTLFSRVWSVQNQSPIFHIAERRVIKLDEFITKNVIVNIPSTAIRKPANPSAARRAAALQLVNSLGNISKRVAREVLNFPTLELAQRTHRVLVLTLTLHACEGIPLPRAAIRPLAILIEALTLAQTQLLRPIPNLSMQIHQQLSTSPPLIQHLLHRAPKAILSPARCVALWIAACAVATHGNNNNTSSSVSGSGSNNSTKPPSNHPLLISPTTQTRPPLCEAIYVREVLGCCDVSGFLRGFPELYKSLLGDAYSDSNAHQRIPLLIMGLSCNSDDGSLEFGISTFQQQQQQRSRMNSVIGSSSPSSNLSMLKSILHSAIETCIADPLCLDIEHDLREYSLLNADDFPKLPPSAKSIRLNRILHIPSMLIDTCQRGGGVKINLKERVHARLSKVFHELVAVSPGLWDAYAGQMRTSARLLYGLEIDMCIFLQPAADYVAQGNILLDVMRDVAGFAMKFNYNLNQELFVERKVTNRHVSTITIKMLRARIGAQGLGTLPTIIDAIYQFLVVKFETLSQLLYDDQVRTFLKKERRWFARERMGGNNNNNSTTTTSSSSSSSATTPPSLVVGSMMIMPPSILSSSSAAASLSQSSAGSSSNSTTFRFYPYEKANNFYTQVKPSLGATGPYLTKLRSTISEIGNVLGFIRSLKSASEGYDGLNTRNNTTTGSEMKPITDPQNYMGILLNVFKQALSPVASATAQTTTTTGNSPNAVEHLENMFMIIPCLCLNFVSSSLAAKDLVVRASKAAGGGKDVYFTDDGFALGIAAVLGVLGQDTSFDALYWFKSVANYYETAALIPTNTNSNSGNLTSGNNNDFISSTAAKKTRAEAREHELLMYAFTFARVIIRKALLSGGGNNNNNNNNTANKTTTATSTTNTSTNNNEGVVTNM